MKAFGLPRLMRSERRRPNCLVFEDGRCRSSAYPAAVLFTPSRPSASAWSRAGWRWALSTVGWTEFSSAAPADRPTDTARRQPENCDTPENGAERKQQPSRGRRPGVVSPGVDRLSKRDATGRFAVGAVCFSRRGRHRRCQTDWSQAVADLSSANGGAAPPRFEARNIARVLEQIADDIDEIILIDGNSTDATLITARSNRPDVRGSAPGRRRQSLLATTPAKKQRSPASNAASTGNSTASAVTAPTATPAARPKWRKLSSLPERRLKSCGASSSPNGRRAAGISSASRSELSANQLLSI